METPLPRLSVPFFNWAGTVPCGNTCSPPRTSTKIRYSRRWVGLSPPGRSVSVPAHVRVHGQPDSRGKRGLSILITSTAPLRPVPQDLEEYEDCDALVTLNKYQVRGCPMPVLPLVSTLV